MQKLLIVLFVLVCGGVYSQGTVKKPIATKKPVKPATAAMKNQADSFSYAIGVSIANFYREQGISNISSSLVTKALNDCKLGKAALDDGQVNNIIMAYMQQKRSEKSAVTRKAGEAFLAENKKKAGVITTASGLQYSILQEGTGPKPAATDKVKIHYHGTLIDGTVFESSVQRGEPIVMRVNEFIVGWVEALQMMSVGSKWRLYIPSNLAYGDNDSGPAIKGGSTLVFEVELIEIVK